MKRISRWAKHHFWKARIIIVFLYIIINLTAFIAGDLLAEKKMLISSNVYYFSTCVLFIACLFYPLKNSINYHQTYLRRKSLDGLLAVTTFIMVCTFCNRQLYNNNSNFFPVSTGAHFYGTNSYALKPAPSENLKQILKSRTTTMKSKVKTFIQKFRNFYNSRSKAEKDWLIVLTVLVAAVATTLLMGLTCSIACGGAEALAFAVFIFGLAAIVTGSVLIIRNIIKKRRLPKPSHHEADPGNAR